MADAWIRNSDWEDDNDLNKDLAKFVSLNLKRMEILDFLRNDMRDTRSECAKGFSVHGNG